jgi:hypothetical protein
MLDIFRDRVSWTICPGWLWTSILRISVSWVPRIIGHRHLVIFFSLTQALKMGMVAYTCNPKSQHLGDRGRGILRQAWMLVAHAYNPSYLGGWDREDCGLRPDRQIVRESSSTK